MLVSVHLLWYSVKGFWRGDGATHLHDIRDLLPLLMRGVDAGGVVRAGVKQHDAVSWRASQVLDQPVEVDGARLLIPVTVNARVREPGTHEYQVMVF